MNGRASKRGVGGAAGEAGAEYRRGVAAYAVACGFAGSPLDGLDIAPIDAHVESVELETDGPVDDLRIRFTSGWVADIQAKRTLRQGRAFRNAIDQWIQAGLDGVDPARRRLVLVSGDVSGSVRLLDRALRRRRLPLSAAPTGSEAAALRQLENMLGSLDDERKARVLDATVILQLQVERSTAPGSREALAHLNRAGFPLATGQAHQAWDRLKTTAGTLARQRGGYDLASWLADLRGTGLTIANPGTNPVGALELRRAALERYADRLIREATQIDLRPLGADLPTINLPEADAGVDVGTHPEDPRKTGDLLWAFLRRHRAVLTGLPGGGKSTALTGSRRTTSSTATEASARRTRRRRRVPVPRARFAA